MKRRIAVVVTTVALSFAALGIGNAHAAAIPPDVSVSCTSASATLKFSPELQVQSGGPNLPIRYGVQGVFSSCTTSSGDAVFGGRFTFKAGNTGPQNCDPPFAYSANAGAYGAVTWYTFGISSGFHQWRSKIELQPSAGSIVENPTSTDRTWVFNIVNGPAFSTAFPRTFTVHTIGWPGGWQNPCPFPLLGPYMSTSGSISVP